MGPKARWTSAVTAAGVAPRTVTKASAGNAKGSMVSSCRQSTRVPGATTSALIMNHRGCH